MCSSTSSDLVVHAAYAVSVVRPSLGNGPLRPGQRSAQQPQPLVRRSATQPREADQTLILAPGTAMQPMDPFDAHEERECPRSAAEDPGCWWCRQHRSHGVHPAQGGDAERGQRREQRHRPRRPHPDSFRGALNHALLLGQAFSMLPPDEGPARGRRWTVTWAMRALYAGVVVAGLAMMAALSLYREMLAESPWDSSVDMMFFGSATAAALLFLELGSNWRPLARDFERVESSMVDSFGYPKNLGRNMKRLSFFVISAAVVEHVLSVWSTVDHSWQCYEDLGLGGLLKGYAKYKFPMTFQVFEYSHWKGLVVLLLNFVGTFFWNFNHLFVMLISMPLAKRFKQVNERLEDVVGKAMDDAFWRRARETYNELSLLVKKVDVVTGKLVLLSFASNMYFICRQLLHSFRTSLRGFWYNLYFSYSFGFMLLRTVLVSLYAAYVNEQSRRPLPILFGVPAEGFCHEVERFLNQVSRDHVALTGCRFFSVTRGLILTVAGTIISYEIVLIQLQPPHSVNGHKVEKIMELCL